MNKMPTFAVTKKKRSFFLVITFYGMSVGYSLLLCIVKGGSDPCFEVFLKIVFMC